MLVKPADRTALLLDCLSYLIGLIAGVADRTPDICDVVTARDHVALKLFGAASKAVDTLACSAHLLRAHATQQPLYTLLPFCCRTPGLVQLPCRVSLARLIKRPNRTVERLRHLHCFRGRIGGGPALNGGNRADDVLIRRVDQRAVG